MPDRKQEIQVKFKAILEKLPPDKKKELYDRLVKMDSEQRNRTIENIVKSSEAKAAQRKAQAKPQQGKPQPKSQGKPKGKPQPKQQGKPKGKPQPKPAAAPKKNVKKPSKAPEKKPVKADKKESISSKDFIDTNKSENEGKKANVVSIIVVVTIVLMSIALLVFTLLKMDKLPFVSKATDDTTVESTDESVLGTTETTPSPTPTPTPSPTPSPVPVKDDAPDLTGLKIVIDPGHQMTTDEETELLATWVSTKKPRCTTGSTGVVSGVHEYELTLDIGLILKSYLEECGATVVITRTENDVNLSNQERAELATASNCDLFIRLHADGANDSATSGIRVYVPDSGNYTRSSVANGDILGNLLADATGLKFDQTVQTQVYTGLNYASSVNSFQVNLGYLTNSDDEEILIDPDMQYEIAAAIAQFCSEVK